jgi:farnesyl diphosphate synthase
VSEFAAFVAANRDRLEDALVARLPLSAAVGADRLNDAIRYSLFRGGKRLRPQLALASARLGGASDAQAVSIACAVEFIHTSSIVLDDLPAMDDATVRRGQPAVHVAFGEGMAILTAVALLNQAYVLLADAEQAGPPGGGSPLIREAVRCLGSAGMVAGQAVELASSGDVTDAILASRELKTTGLMRLTTVAGAVVARAPQREADALAAFGESLGRAYQLYDDLADRVGDVQATGKSVGQDRRHRRPTAVRALSAADVRQRAADTIESGKAALVVFGSRSDVALLRSAADAVTAVFMRGPA